MKWDQLCTSMSDVLGNKQMKSNFQILLLIFYNGNISEIRISTGQNLSHMGKHIWCQFVLVYSGCIGIVPMIDTFKHWFCVPLRTDTLKRRKIPLHSPQLVKIICYTRLHRPGRETVNRKMSEFKIVKKANHSTDCQRKV